MHSTLLVSHKGRRVMIDCGEDWLGKLDSVSPMSIVLTHAHPDHAWGLKEGSPCPVYATGESWELLDKYPIEERTKVLPREPFQVEGIEFEAFTVEHSTRCPAVSYRISAGEVTVHYAPDVVYIHDRGEALEGAKLYVGDGATLARPIIRKRGEHLIGHSPVRSQLIWCQKERVPKAMFTHCGTQIVDGDERRIIPLVRGWGEERSVEASIAYDGLELVIR